MCRRLCCCVKRMAFSAFHPVFLLLRPSVAVPAFSCWVSARWVTRALLAQRLGRYGGNQRFSVGWRFASKVYLLHLVTVAVDALQRELHHPRRELRRGRRQGVAAFEKGVRLVRAGLWISDGEAYLVCYWIESVLSEWYSMLIPPQFEVVGKLCEVKTRLLNWDALSCTGRDDARSREVPARSTYDYVQG